jgi:ketosteroid isomerase-like protein
MSPARFPARRRCAPVARLALASTILLSFAAGCQTAPKPNQAALRSVMDAADRQLMDAFARKDGTAIGLLYAEDAQAMPPGAVEIEGRAAIEAMWKGMLSLPLSGLELKTSEIGGGVETAWQAGHYRLMQNDGSVADAGKYVVIWKESEGGWKIYRGIWNSDALSATLATETPASPPGK